MYSELFDFLPRERIRINEPMKDHSSFKIGGPVDILVLPESVEEIQRTIHYCREKDIPYFIFGLGSNLLVRDKGIRGVAIKVGNNLRNFSIFNEEIFAEAGVRLAELSQAAADYNLGGLEFAEGIPGSLGGAVVMNAGAYGGEMKDVLKEVRAITPDGKLSSFKPEEMKLRYRGSIFQEEELIVVSALMQLRREKAEDIRARMQDFAKRRREKQPLEYPSAGSTFRRPSGFFVGPMIEEMGLKGFKVGGAEVSRKHAGFIINTGNASASEVLELIAIVKAKAKEHYGIELETEIKVVGEE
ncbi:MAG: UDP-N-acetylmuramate dehydrogenase [Syntrophomonas sp.]|uniref:UDP-N-acetylmuramate dehydrogenase n=1 Tax=Syntrophomonas sp. TaxID=2053627 RepID=UPI002614B2D6|nr:UDP-N-acetylmuramate dehydrogenase [Syntrophomonas sp.]MDD2509947.1 UDP-N-acetylmuramate dehydrogenase [Syntrophomonas sp.]MDD4626027.1 UDP-N-acetylmuramate dehydrogenase [Syntrophomonas sp.]